MDDIFSKGLNAISGGILSASSLFNSFSQRAQSIGAAESQPVNEFLLHLSRTTSKQEERQLVQQQCLQLQTVLREREVKPGIIREAIIKCICCHLLGYDVAFIYIYALKLAQCGTLLDKKVGYLAACLFLTSEHELAILLVNTIQRDLRSTLPLEISCALTAAGSLLGLDTIPAVLPLVCDRLRHSHAYVRKKAVSCLRSFLRAAPSLEEELRGPLRLVLCDKDPSVMWSALHVYDSLIRVAPKEYGDVVPTLVDILRQLINGRLPQEFDYSNCPSPFLIVRLLQLLARLGSQSQSHISSKMYQVLAELIEKFQWQSLNCTFAITSECCLTACTIHPLDTLLSMSSQYAGRLLTSCHSNTVYTGLKILSRLARAQRFDLVKPYQLVLVENLESKDAMIRKQVLDLLYEIASSSNVEVVFTKFLEQVSTISEASADIVDKMFTLMERCSPSAMWYVMKLRALLLKCSNDGQYGTRMNQLITTAIKNAQLVLQRYSSWQQEIATELWRHVSVTEHSNARSDCFVVVATWVVCHLCFDGVTPETHDSDNAAGQIVSTLIAHARLMTALEARLWLLCSAKRLLLLAIVSATCTGLGCILPEDKHIFATVAERQLLDEIKALQTMSSQLRLIGSKLLPVIHDTSEDVIDVSFLPVLLEPQEADGSVGSPAQRNGRQIDQLRFVTHSDSPMHSKHVLANPVPALDRKRSDGAPTASAGRLWTAEGRRSATEGRARGLQDCLDPEVNRKQQLAAALFEGAAASADRHPKQSMP